MGVNEPTAERQAARPDTLELLVKIAALVAVLLPAIGAAVRATAFALAGVPNPLEIAVAQPVSELISTALKAVVPIAAGLVVLAPSIYREWPRPNVVPHFYHRVATPFAVAVGALFLGGAAFLLAWPGGVIGMLGLGIVGWILGYWAARQELTFYRLAAAVLLAAIASGLGAGINGVAVGDQVNNYRFASSAALADGKYVLVGESNGFVYLESCQRQGILGVSQQDIVEFNASAASNPWPSDSLYGIIFTGGAPKIGYRPNC